ncbi:hypothetical protein PPGU16_81780 (plasmid) [Paraburkholderia largidicola]|uniref:Uncharacterized protein n=1 Tax=Paraburkholderia largidicola TaxID=3014751 RepID=A0A7I8C3P3_9BURK|nr:hypothetical protein PPGU16_81780 [Paraburkholderia sp. PGU16]
MLSSVYHPDGLMMRERIRHGSRHGRRSQSFLPGSWIGQTYAPIWPCLDRAAAAPAHNMRWRCRAVDACSPWQTLTNRRCQRDIPEAFNIIGP